jgi:hypothetical protein
MHARQRMIKRFSLTVRPLKRAMLVKTTVWWKPVLPAHQLPAGA